MARMAAAAAWGLGKAALPGMGRTVKLEARLWVARHCGCRQSVRSTEAWSHSCPLPPLPLVLSVFMALINLLDMHENLSSQGSQGKQCASINTEMISEVCILAPLSLASFCVSAFPGASVSWSSMIAGVLPACFYPTGIMKEVSCLSPWFLNFIVEFSQRW